jgi:hypothetical protein
MIQPVVPASYIAPPVHKAAPSCQNAPLCTPTSTRSLETFQKQIEAYTKSSRSLHEVHFEKTIKALEKAFANGALLRKEIGGLLEQNNEKRSRKSLKRTMVSQGKIMSYEDIVTVREQQAEREGAKKGKQSAKVQRRAVKATGREAKSPLSKEFQAAEAEIRTMDLEKHCTVLRF